jgi:hypothetical protein
MFDLSGSTVVRKRPESAHRRHPHEADDGSLSTRNGFFDTGCAPAVL